MGDAGLTGRKIIVDTYGGAARHGGGAFSGKDPSKVDRSAAYAARYVAKNVVAAGLADRCEVQVAYAIGVAHPVSLMVETFGTGKVSDSEIVTRLVREYFDLRPARLPALPRPAPADLPEDGRLRPLRPRGRGLHLGAHRPRGRASCGRGPRLRGRRGRAQARASRARAPGSELGLRALACDCAAVGWSPRPVGEMAWVARSTCSTTSLGVRDADEDEVEVVAARPCRSRRRRPGAGARSGDWL